MKRSRKRRSSAALSARALKDIRKLHRAHLREVSAILTNALGFPVRVSLVPTAIVDEKSGKPASRVLRQRGISRKAATFAGFGEAPGVRADRRDYETGAELWPEEPEGEEE